jgi:hypothetical protein
MTNIKLNIMRWKCFILKNDAPIIMKIYMFIAVFLPHEEP